MQFTLIEQLNGFTSEVDTIAFILSETFVESEQALYETADGVLDSLYTMLKNGGRFSEKEAEDYAEIVAGLSLLSIDDNRQALNINIATPEGQQKFLNVMDHVGEHNGISLQVRRLARDEDGSQYRSILNKIKFFSQSNPMEQQKFLVDVNKLRIGYRKVREQMANGEFQQKRDALQQAQ